MNAAMERYKLREQCLNFIQSELRRIYRRCEWLPTIEQSNRLFFYTFDTAKAQAFKSIEYSVHKPWVIYSVNSYYKEYHERIRRIRW